MTGFEKSHLSCTQQQHRLLTIKQQLYTLTNNLAKYWSWKLPRLLCCGLFLRLVRYPWVLGSLSNGSISLDKHTGGCNSPHKWLMSLAMDLAALCDMWRWKWHQWWPFGCFEWSHSLYLSLHGYPPAPTLPPCRIASGTPVKNHLNGGQFCYLLTQ